jgi:hypothetical protein
MSVLAVDPHAAWYVKAGAEALLVLHIGGGSVGMVSGAAALVMRKGRRLHALAGRVFFIAMLAMAGIGAAVSWVMREPPNVIAGIMTLYLILTSWVTIRRRDGRIGRFEVGGLLVALTVAAAGAFFIHKALNSPAGAVGDTPAQAFYLFLLVGVISAACDLKVILKGAITGAPRLARHLWRMCAALAIALGSFLFGQSQVLPAALRDSPLLPVVMFTPVVLLILWQVRLRFRNRLVAVRPNALDAAVS